MPCIYRSLQPFERALGQRLGQVSLRLEVGVVLVGGQTGVLPGGEAAL